MKSLTAMIIDINVLMIRCRKNNNENWEKKNNERTLREKEKLQKLGNTGSGHHKRRWKKKFKKREKREPQTNEETFGN